VLKPKIILPTGFFLADKQLAEHALHHEAQHIRHMDSLLNMMWLVLICIHWFNPLVWICWVLLKKDMEFRCDAAVVKRLGYGGKAGYARSLLELTPVQGNPYPVLSMALSSANVKARIVYIMGLRKPTFLSRLIAAVLVVAIMLPVFFISVSAAVPNIAVSRYTTVTTVFISPGSDEYAVIRVLPAESGANQYFMELAGFMDAPSESLEFSRRGFGIDDGNQQLLFAFEGANLIADSEESAVWYKLLRISSFGSDDDINAHEALWHITTTPTPWYFGVYYS